MTGHWLVVAYPTESPGAGHRRRVGSTEEAMRLITEWSEAIKSGQLALAAR